MIDRRLRLLVAAILLSVFGGQTSPADSAIELLSGFDSERIDACYPAGDSTTTGELAKLLYRLRKADVAALSDLVDSSSPESELALGDATSVDGLVVSARNLKVPEALVEFLEFKFFQEIKITPDTATAGETIKVLAPAVSGDLSAGDRISGIGVVLEVPQSAAGLAVAIGKLKWFPQQPPSESWRLLSDQGVDVSALAEINSRNRMPLVAADADAFYPMLAAAEKIGGQADVAAPQKAIPLELLTAPEEFSGEWLSMRVETVRITRVSVTQPQRQQQLGSDHYYQIDAKGDLGKKVIQIDRPDGDPIRFANTYPVSLVATKLPDFLSAELEKKNDGDDAVVAMVSMPIRVEGFFFRLWSYSSDYMERQGGGDQFGPLLIAARMTHTPAAQGDPMGIRVIGYAAAAAIILGILATFVWSRSNTRQDDQERRKRLDREAERLKLPDDLG